MLRGRLAEYLVDSLFERLQLDLHLIDGNAEVLVRLFGLKHLLNDVEERVHLGVLRHDVRSLLVTQGLLICEFVVDFLSEVLELLEVNSDF